MSTMTIIAAFVYQETRKSKPTNQSAANMRNPTHNSLGAEIVVHM